MEQPTAQQLREELLIEFDFTAPANWGIPALSKKLAELQAARDAEQGADESADESTDESPDESTNETHDQQGNEDAAKQSEQGDSPAAAVPPKAAEPDETANSVLMLTLHNHEVPGSEPKQVRVRHEHFYTRSPELYAGVAKVVAELAPDNSEAL